MNIVVGPSLCFGFNFKIEKDMEIDESQSEDMEIDDLYIDDEPVVEIDVEIIKSEAEIKIDNIIDLLKNVQGINKKQDKIIILDRVVNENTIGLTTEEKNEYIQVLRIFLNTLDNQKFKQLLIDLYR